MRQMSSILKAPSLPPHPIHALLTEYYYRVKDYAHTYTTIIPMRVARVVTFPYIDNVMIARIRKDKESTQSQQEREPRETTLQRTCNC
jgi:hypothetical protein